MNVEFDEALHQYKIDGTIVPSVTQCLQLLDPFERVDRAVLEAARQFGQHVHRAMHLLLKDRLNWSSLDRSLVPYVEGGAEFLRLNPEMLVLHVEKIVASKELGVAGTVDLITEDDRCTNIIEWKATADQPVNAGPQTEAYARMYLAEMVRQQVLANKGLRLLRTKRLCVVLKPGGFDVEVLNDPADWPDFVSCLNVTKRRWKYGISGPRN